MAVTQSRAETSLNWVADEPRDYAAQSRQLCLWEGMLLTGEFLSPSFPSNVKNVPLEDMFSTKFYFYYL